MGFLKKFQDTEKEATVKAFKADGLRVMRRRDGWTISRPMGKRVRRRA